MCDRVVWKILDDTRGYVKCYTSILIWNALTTDCLSQIKAKFTRCSFLVLKKYSILLLLACCFTQSLSTCGITEFLRSKPMSSLEELEQRVTRIEDRNKRVEINKAWETSYSRIFLIALTTYTVIALYMRFVLGVNPWINALVPMVGFV